MSQKLKYHLKENVTKIKMSLKLIFDQNSNVTKTDMSLILRSHQNWNITKTDKYQKYISPKLKYHKKNKYHLNGNVN